MVMVHSTEVFSMTPLSQGGDENKERLVQIERWTKIIQDVVDQETVTALYELILEHTTGYFGFDYGSISRVDSKSKRVKTEICKSVKPHLVDPNRWKDESDYGWDDKDILVDVARNKKSEVISGPAVQLKWDPRLNQHIYDANNHKELVRLYVPFTHRSATSALRDERGSNPIEEKVLGVIEAGYHIKTCEHVSVEQRALFELFINYCAGAFQRVILLEERMAFNKIVERVNAEENLLSSAEENYDILRKVVEEYLNIKTVTLWEKDTAKNANNQPFRLRRVAASKFMEEQYDLEDIWELPRNCLTADAMNKIGQVTEVKLDEVTIKRLAHPQIALRNKFSSIVTIPIHIGQETYAVADVFFGPNRHLTVDEKEFLERFASTATIAMVAVQNAKLADSFSKIADTLLDEDVEVILQRITDSALEVLHANPVIIFRYEQEPGEFAKDMISSGSFLYPGFMDGIVELTTDDWPNIILNLDRSAEYLDSEQAYMKFQESVRRVGRHDREESDFWHREKIESAALLRLQHKDEPLGIMFINYRTPQKFNEPTKRLIEAFAAQAAAAIANAKLLEQKQAFWELQRRDSLSLSVSEIVTSLAHNSGNLVYSLSVYFAALDDLLKKGDGKYVDKEKATSHADNMREPLTELVADFRRLQEYRKFSEFKEEDCQVEDLIENTLRVIQSRIERNRIVVKKSYLLSAPQTPVIRCDKNQIQHLLLNLLINALDAMGRKGTLSVGAEVFGNENFIRIRISDTGTGIPAELHSKIFQPYFTTKPKSGTGLGLPVSRYIAEEHGGSIEFTSRSGKETSFFVLLPIERETTDGESKKNSHR
jgi:signal transduction histidine kinase